ncbi:glycosyltransferase [Paenibacillus taichungensis]
MKNFWSTVIEPILKVCNSKSIIEIGSDRGINTRNILSYCKRENAVLHAIDPSPRFGNEEWIQEYSGQLKLHYGLSLNVISTLDSFDTVFVDGDHNWYTVYHELKLIEKQSVVLEQDLPIILLHDVGWPYARRDMYYNPETVPPPFRQPYEKKGLKYGEPELQEIGGLNAHLYNSIYENNFKNGVKTAIEDFIAESKEKLKYLEIPGFNSLGIIVKADLIQSNAALKDLLQKLELEPWMFDHLNNVEIARISEKAAKETAEHKLKEKVSALEEKEEVIKNQEELIAQNERRLLEMEHEIKDLTQKLNRFEQGITDKDEQIKNLQRQLEDHKRQLTLKNENNEKLLYQKESDISRLKNWLDSLEHGTTALLNSNRWKIGDAIGETQRKLLRKPNEPTPNDYIQEIFESYHQWNRRNNGSHNSLNKKKSKIIVYTCLLGEYEFVKEPLFKSDGVEYILFTDNKNLKSIGWDIRYIDIKLSNPRRTSRLAKILAHKYLPPHDVSVYIDASLEIKTEDVHSMVSECLNDKEIALFKHPVRNCLYEEVDYCVSQNENLLHDGTLQKQKYLKDGLPENYGLFENAFIVRKNTKAIQQLNDLWWSEYENGAERDQFSLMYCLWKLEVKVNSISKGRDFRSNPFVNFYSHHGNVPKVVVKDPLYTVNWLTGGASNKGWAYENNATRFKENIDQFHHEINSEKKSDIAVYFDVRIYEQVGNAAAVNVLRIGGPRPLQILYQEDGQKLREGLSKFDAVIALSPDLYRVAKEANENTYMVPNGLDLSYWTYSYKPSKKKNFVVGFAGNLSTSKEKEFKGFDLAKEACDALGVKLFYVEKNKNQLPHDQMIEGFYSKIDCLIHPVKAGKEGSSNVIMEALALGIPVITTRDAGFHGHFLEDEKNVIFCERDVQTIKEKISLLMNDMELRTRISHQGRKFCEEHHDIHIISKIYGSIFEECIHNKKQISFVPYRRPVNEFASSRLRAKYLMDFFKEKNEDILISMDNFETADVVVVNQLITDTNFEKLNDLIVSKKVFVIYDVADRYYEDDKVQQDGVIPRDTFHKMAKISNLITVPNEMLQWEVQKLGINVEVVVIPDGLDYIEQLDTTLVPINRKVVWFGNSGRGNLSSSLWALNYIASNSEYSVTVMSHKDSKIPGVGFVKWKYEGFVETLKGYSVCFLSHDPTEQQKSNNKLLVAVANGVPCIVSGSAAYSEILLKFGLDYAVVSNEAELQQALEKLDDEETRRQYFEALQPYILNHYSYETIGEQFLHVIEEKSSNSSGFIKEKAYGAQNYAVCSHNLNGTEGAPKSLFELVKGLKSATNAQITVYSPVDGPLREHYQANGITVQILDGARNRRVFNHKTTPEEYTNFVNEFTDLVKEQEADFLIANTADMFYAVQVAYDLALPSIWIIRESREPLNYYDYLSPVLQDEAHKQFSQASKVVFVSYQTELLWKKYFDFSSHVIFNGINFSALRIADEPQRQEIRSRFGIKSNDVVFINVGVISDRKGQEDLVKAIKLLDREIIAKSHFFFVGARNNSYLETFKAEVQQIHEMNNARIYLVEETGDINDYYSMADVFVFNSRIESYPRVIVEGMHYSLPIITTPVFGVLDQTIENVNALYYEAGEYQKLADHITKLGRYEYVRQTMSLFSKKRSEYLLSYDQMIDRYATLVNTITKE